MFNFPSRFPIQNRFDIWSQSPPVKDPTLRSGFQDSYPIYTDMQAHKNHLPRARLAVTTTPDDLESVPDFAQEP